MNILALDTATDACSAAVLIDGQCHEAFELAPRQHTHLILHQIEQVCTSANIRLSDIDAFAFGQGPGAFTGLRIAAGVIQGLALAADKPVIAVSTLAAMALQTIEKHQADRVYVGLDARMAEVYWGVYQRDFVEKRATVKTVCADCVIKPDSVPLPHNNPESHTENSWAMGAAWQAYSAELSQRLHTQAIEIPTTRILPECYPSAAYIARLAQAKALAEPKSLVDAAQAQPIYLRNKVAQTISERQGIVR
jgi:tRNA threonylcarbamoyladenosine biosynthesis protein TsaB